MKQLLLYTILFWSNISFAQYREWHVQTLANGGSPTGLGTPDSPWDLQTAFNQPNTIVKPGDVVWLHSGIYSGRFTSNLNGNSNNFITVSSYPGEWAILNGNIFTSVSDPATPTCNLIINTAEKLNSEEENIPTPEDLTSYLDEEDEEDSDPVLEILGGYVTFKDFEVTFLGSFTRILDDNNPSSFSKVHGISHLPIDSNKPTVKLINLMVRNIPGTGIGSWKNAANSEIYGCNIYNNGYSWFQRDNVVSSSFPIFGKGPGIYTQNNSTDLNNPRLIENNIIHNNYDSGILVWSSSSNPTSDYIRNYDIANNIIFNNGNPSRRHLETSSGYSDSKPNIVVDSYSGNQYNHPTNINIRDNKFYLNTLNFISGMRVSNGNNINIHNNYIFKGTKGGHFSLDNIDLSFNHNLFWGKYIGFGATVDSALSNNWNFDNNTYHPWDFTVYRMYEIPNPSFINSTQTPDIEEFLDVPFNDFKIRYSNISAESISTDTPKIYGNAGLLSFFPTTLATLNDPNYFEVKSFITQNKYAPNFFFVTIFNARGLDSVNGPVDNAIYNTNVSFSQYNIPPNAAYRIRDVQNYNNSYIEGTYTDSPINFDLTSTDVEPPTGYYNTPCLLHRKRDFAVYIVEFGCQILYDTFVQNTIDSSGYKLYEAKNNIFFGPSYVADTSSDIVANASKQIVLKPNTRIKSTAKFHAEIVDPCPDLTYIGEGSSSKQSIATVNPKPTSEETKMLIVYPNPNSGVFKIESLKESKIKQIIIRDINSAKTVFEQTYNPEKIVDINISSRPLGLYVVEVTFENNSRSTKTIIKK